MILKFATPELNLPIEAVTQTFAFLGKRGGGKSYAATKLCELMLEAGAQIVALDVVGNWCGLRIPATKGGKAFDNVLVFGGLNGDFEINPKAGRIIAETIINKNLCAVVDISQFIHSEQTRFAYDFLTTLFEKKKKSPSAIHLFFEEAQELVPQNLPAGAKGENYAARMLSAGERLVKLGRNYGIGCSLISQRPQEVNKKVLNQSEVFLAFQMTGIQERKTVAEWVRDKGSREELVDSLPYLEIGQALCWSPSWLRFEDTVRILPKLTADVSATPKVGAAIGQTKTLKPVDVEDLKKSISDLTDEIEKDTPAAYKKQIAELTSKLAKAEKAQPAPAVQPVAAYPTKEIAALTETINLFRAEYIGQLKTISESFAALNGQKVFEKIEGLAGKVIAGMPRQGAPVIPAFARDRSVVTPKPKVPSSVNRSMPVSGDFQPNKTQQRILDALEWFISLGNTSPTMNQLGAVALIDPTGGYFSNTVGPLVTNGLVIRGSGKISITNAGRSYANPLEDAATLADYHEVLRSRIRKMKSASGRTIDILNVIIQASGDSLSVEQIGERIGIDHTGGYFSNSIGPLTTAGVITRSSGIVAPTDVLFPEGLY